MIEQNNKIYSYARLLTFVLILFILSVLISEVYVLKNMSNSFIDGKTKELIAIAQLKTNQIEEWNYERQQDAKLIQSYSTYFTQLIENASISKENYLLLKMAFNSILDNYNYESIRVIDHHQTILYSIPENVNKLGSYLSQILPEVIANDELFISDIHRSSPNANPHFDYIIPLKNQFQKKEVGFFIILSVTPYKVLFPLIQSWPTPSKSSETLIIRSKNDTVEFINELRHKKNGSLNLSISIKNNPELTASMAAKGIVGVVEGNDYRNVPVYAVIQPIKNSKWIMIAKTDKTEIQNQLSKDQFVVYVITFLVILLTLSALAFIWRKQRIAYYKQQLEGEKERRAIIEHYDYLLKYANDIIILLDKSLKIIEANDRAIEVYGYDYSKLIGMNMNSLRSTNDQSLNIEMTKFEEFGSMIIETTHITFDKRIIQVEESIRQIMIDNNFYIQIIARDITARKQAEAALAQKDKSFENIFTNMEEGVALHEIVFDESGRPINYRIVEVNPQFEIITGIRKTDAIGKLATECYQISEPPYLKEYTDASTKLEKYYFETYFPQMDKFFSISVLPWGNDGEGFATIFSDITDRVKNEQEIMTLNTQLEKRVKERTMQLEVLNKELEAFSYSVSHDLRAPLRAIEGFSDILIDEYTSKIDEDGIKLFETIRESANKMKVLINDLLSFSRFSRHEIVHQSIDMHKMVVKVVDELKSQNNYANAEVSVDKLPEIVSDYMLILQVWRNLISNALKYSARKTTPEISIKYSEINDEIIYEITDNGVGFNMQYADKLFGVFQRLHSDKEFEGTGVGLAIVQRIINRLNGRVWAESKVNEGASFFFAFKKE